MRNVVIAILRIYQRLFSLDRGYLRMVFPARNVCTMYPSCSEYTIKAVEKYGAIKGLWKGFWRIGRCHPWQKTLIDIP